MKIIISSKILKALILITTVVTLATISQSIKIHSSSHHKHSQSKNSRFKELEMTPTNLETPTIVSSLGYGDRFNVKRRVAQTQEQRISQLQAYDVLYKNHRDYYDKDKKLYIYDTHFEETEKYLIGKFADAIKKGVEWDSNLKHVDEYRGNKKNIDLSNSPRYNPDAAKTSLNYGELNTKNSNVKVTTSDPYSDMFGSRQ